MENIKTYLTSRVKERMSGQFYFDEYVLINAARMSGFAYKGLSKNGKKRFKQDCYDSVLLSVDQIKTREFYYSIL